MKEWPIIWWLDIEGIRLRYCNILPPWGPPEGGTNRAFRDWMSELPRIERQSVEPLDGKTKLAGFSVSLLDVGDQLCDLFSSYKSGGVTYLTAGITAGQTTITVQDATVFALPCDIYIDRETLRAVSANGNTINVERGMYGTKAEEHRLIDQDGYLRSVVVADHPLYWLGRRCLLSWVGYHAAPEAASVLGGTIRGIEEDDGEWVLKADGYVAPLGRKIGENVLCGKLSAGLWGGEKSIPGGAGSYNYVGTTSACLRIEPGPHYLYPTAGTVLIGGTEIVTYRKRTTNINGILMIAPRGQVSPWEHMVTSYQNCFQFVPQIAGRALLRQEIYGTELQLDRWHRPTLGNNEPAFLYHTTGEEVRLIVTHADFARGDFETLSAPLVALQIMCSTGLGTNGAWDTLPKQYGLGIDQSLIDIGAFLAEADRLDGISDCRFYIGESVEAKQWIEENLLRPWMLYLVEDVQGRISISHVRTELEAVGASPVVISHDDILELPEYMPGEETPVSEVKWKINRTPAGGEYLGEITIVMGDTRELYRGSARKVGDLEVATIYDHRVTGGSARCNPMSGAGIGGSLDLYGARLWDRFANVPTPKIKFKVAIDKYSVIRPGAIVRVTSSLLPDWMGGKRGISGELFEVQAVKIDPADSSIEVQCWHIGGKRGALGGYRKIAPSAKVGAWNNATKTITCDSNVFSRLGPDAGMFRSGDKIILLDANYRPLGGAADPEVLTIDRVSGDDIVLTSVPAHAPAKGDYVDTAYYDPQQESQKLEWASMAKADGTLGAAGDPGHVRS